MKKLFLLTTVLLFGMTACQKTEMSDATSGNTQITIKASFPAQMAETRAAGDGTTVDRCIMQIYLDGELYGERQVAEVNGLKATFSARLVAGKTFDLVFWADKKGADLNTDLHYNTADLSNVTFAEGDAYLGNDDARDAFFGTAQVVADQSKAVSVELRRPFGQLNIITNDWGAIPDEAAAQLRPAKVKLTFYDVPNTIDLLTGEVSGAADISGEAVEVSKIAQDGDAKHLSFDYILAEPDDQTILTDFTMDFLADDDNTKVTDTYTFTNIPVQRNYQTNVRGNLLTDRTGVEIEVVPEFYTPAIEISTEEELVGILTNGGNAVLTGDVTVSSQYLTLEEGENALLDLADHTITFDANGTALTATGASVTFKNGTIIADKIEKVNVSAMTLGENGSMELDGITMVTNGTGPSIPEGAHGSRLTIRNSNIAAPSAYAVSTNASVATQDVVITLENSEFSGSSPVFINIPCTLNMSGCMVNATMHGLVVRGGTATVKDCHITMTYPKDETQDEAESMADYFDNRNVNVKFKVANNHNVISYYSFK